MLIPFLKMHGAGNDFVVFDARREPIALTPEQVRRVADRRRGVGCDQVVVLESGVNGADLFMHIHNADGGEVDACGNATRCAAWLAMKDTKAKSAVIATRAGALRCEDAGPKRVLVDMGAPKLGWREIPLAAERDTLHLPLEYDGLKDPAAVGMGNPHLVFFVPDVSRIDLAKVGPVLEHHPLFPERANVGIAEIMDRDRIKLRVWERGTGETLACGTAACAALVAANRRGLTERVASVILPGGALEIEWRASDGHVLMAGPVSKSFRGTLRL